MRCGDHGRHRPQYGRSYFVKFCKIGALSATGCRPYAEGADGFVMGEGAVVFILKRLADAERDGDKIYAVLRGMAGSSDGKGKGITAPNPVGQKFLSAVRGKARACHLPARPCWKAMAPPRASAIWWKWRSMLDVLDEYHLPAHSIALGSVKSNIGHLKAASGAAGMLKATLALHEKVLPPSINCDRPNPEIDFAHSPLYVNTELRPWPVPPDGVRRAGVSAFGFGGTNFHAVLEEYIPDRLSTNAGKRRCLGPARRAGPQALKAPLRGALVIGAANAGCPHRTASRRSPARQTGDARPPAAPSRIRSARARAAGDRLRRCRRSGRQSGQGAQGVEANQPAVGRPCVPRESIAGMARPPKSRFCFPAKARSI